MDAAVYIGLAVIKQERDAEVSEGLLGLGLS